ncbi:hypothetical protein SAPIO_CDS0441 [Scedosporium apiospermum]|uniref:NACHT domain-containing protein n=1 Tax=Pseudallescheria apiosperma TaxID=563466 RepID=A0A084GH05_PSEDA|nr:uncharacterized protein SAPIO_CDS0441 [Scedosporium apiospermum]KEZ46617.1 hypothetical protein SAPIO_CDS0441 [Scedosporium apiospermum]
MARLASTDLDEAFEAARAEFVGSLKRRSLPAAQALSKATTIQHVLDAIAEVEAQQQRSGKLRALGRLKPLVNGLKEYAGVVEVFIQAKQDILSLIWGPLKFILEATSRVITLFEKMIEVFSEIGRILPQFQKYREILEDEQIQPVLTLFYKEILALYSTLLDFLKHPGRNTFLESIWPNVRSKIGVILDNIKDHERVLLSHVTLEHVLQSHRERKQALKAEEEAEMARNRQYWKEMEKEVVPKLYDVRLYEILSDSSFDSGQWLEKNTRFRIWRDGMGKNRCLWLSGIPGAGKTYIAGNSLRPEILRSYSANERKFASSPEWIRDLLSRVLHDKPVFIFLDGLDELDEKRRGETKCREEILQDIFHVVDSCPLVRLLVSSRVESDLKRQLSAKRTLQLRVHENNSDDIKKYVDLECGRLVNRLREFGANEEICSQVQDASAIVVERAGGMILYASLIFQIAMDLGNVEDIRAEFAGLPQNLDEAYGRVLSRIRSSRVPNVREAARKVLSWVACQKRTLREEELLQILAIVPGTQDFTKGRKDHRDILQACGPIIEIVDGFIHFVHFSAKEYLLGEQSNHFLVLRDAHVEAATICATYLSFSLLDSVFECNANPVQHEIHDGGYVFLNYAVLSWIHHVKEISVPGAHENNIDTPALGTLVACLKRLLEKRGQPFQRTASAKVLLPSFNVFRNHRDLQSSLCGIAYFMGRAEHDLLGEGSIDGDGSQPNQDPTTLLTGLKMFRSKLAANFCEDAVHVSECRCENLVRLYGESIYYCNQYHCPKFRDGYKTAEMRLHHMRVHGRLIRVPEIGSGASVDKIPFPVAESPQSETNIDIVNLSGDDLDGMLLDAVCSNQIELASKLWPSSGKLPGNADELVQFAAWKCSPEMVRLLCSAVASAMSNAQAFKDVLNQALAVAIETENLTNIRTLISLGAEVANRSSMSALLAEALFGEISSKRYGKPITHKLGLPD